MLLNLSRSTPLCGAILCFGFAAQAAEPPPQNIEFFEKSVRPILASKCFGCHSVNAKRLEGGLMLDSRARLLKGGDTEPAIVPGKPDKSLLIEAVRYESLEMPPKGKLKKSEIDALVEWVSIGAPWPTEPEPVANTKVEVFDWKQRAKDHWCWQPVKAVPPPATKDTGWPTSAIDKFVLAKLEANGLSPNTDADRRTLIRRVTFDLIGLPPSPEEVTAFVADKSDNAFEKVVDRLLKSEHFGEKWARHWMDLTRYAEAYGHEFDYSIPNPHRYRDYLIRAYNQDVQYDQFVREHVAGDLLPKPRMHLTEGYDESVIGTAFWWFGEATHAPTDVKGDEAIRVDNQLDVFSKSFLGVSLACARCHDHKFDPIPQSDYYAMAGFLQSSRRQEAMLDPGGKIHAASNQLRKLHAQGDQAVNKLMAGWLKADEVAEYLLATREAIANGREVSTTAKPANDADIVFEDFEGGNYDGWKITGDAFGSAPSKGTNAQQQPVSGFLGKGLVNTYPGRDNAKGTATSDEFTIDRDYINLLVGGGHFKDQTCVNLLVGGKVVQSAVGRGLQEREKLSPRTWDVRAHRGKRATIQIVDQATGGWGHINVDHIVFSNTAGAKPTEPALSNVPSTEVIAAVAKSRGLDATLLRSWTTAVLDPETKSPAHPLYVWSQLADALEAGGKRAIDARERLHQQLTDADKLAKETRAKLKLVGDFADGRMDGWFTTGEAFLSQPTSLTWKPGGSDLAEPNVAHSGLLSNRLQGVLRTPTFKLTEPSIWVRMNARDVTVRVIIDGYFMEPFNGLLYRGTRLDPRGSNTNGKFEWKNFGGDLKLHVGQTAYLEFIDHGDGFVAVDEVYVGSTRPADRPSPLALGVTKRKPETLKQLAEEIALQWAMTVNGLDSALPKGDGARLVGFALEHQLIRQVDDFKQAIDLLTKTSKAMQAIEPTISQPQLTLALTDGTPENERLFLRGNHKRLSDVIERRLLVALADEKQPAITKSSGRLELADRMLARANPLTSRVMVNRLWHHLFGRGIVASVDDFGQMGQLPTHPQLLDWLADDFRSNGWSVKRTIKQIVMSRTYRQSSTPPPVGHRAYEVDPDNTLLYRAPIRRLQAEAIRDAILSVSGRLDRKVLGPSVGVHLTAFMQGRGRPGSGPLDGAGRRSLYLATRRNFLSGMMLTFDFPIPFSSMGRRSVSNVPAQALVMMNDPFVVEQAKLWAKRALAESSTTDQRITHMFEQAFASPPSSKQLAGAKQFIDQQAMTYAANQNDERVWADLAHTLLNMKSFIYIN